MMFEWSYNETRRSSIVGETVGHRCRLLSVDVVPWRPVLLYLLILFLLITGMCVDATEQTDVDRRSTIWTPLPPPNEVSASSDVVIGQRSSLVTHSKPPNPRRVFDRKQNFIHDVVASDSSRIAMTKTSFDAVTKNHSLAGSATSRPVTSDSHHEGRTRKLPHAIIIGVKKGGTRALLEFLKIHPDVRAPGPEIHFFDRHYDKGLEWYRSRMPPTLQGQLTIEKTPSYFVTRSAPLRVRRSMSSNVRLIVVIRDPVTRALSDYTQALVKRPDLLPFESMAFGTAQTPSNITSPSTTPAPRHPIISSTSVNTSWGAIRIGLYARHLERWTRWFTPDRFHFVNGERLIDDPAGEISRLEDFLGVQRVVTAEHFYFNVTKGFPCLKKSEARAVPRCLGQAKGRAHPVVDPTAIAELRRFFRPYNKRFYQMTGIDFGWP